MVESIHRLEDQVVQHAEEHGQHDLGSFACLVGEVTSRKQKQTTAEAATEKAKVNVDAFAVDVNHQLEIECEVSLEDLKKWKNLNDPAVQGQIGAVIQRAGEVRMAKLE